jgi:biotin carboxyl carrier protein
LLSRYEILIEKSKKSVEITGAPPSSQEESQKLESYICEMADSTNNPPRKVVVVRRKSPTMLFVSIDDKMYSVRQTKRTPSSVDFILNGRSIQALILKETETHTIQSVVASLNELVSSNFPAKVVSIKVSKGNDLKEGDTLLILEAMKMEAQIKAPKNCRVVEIFVREGEMVPRGAKLVQLKFEE